MAWKDAERIFSSFDVCVRSVGVQDLQLNLKEADSCAANSLGPLKGCCTGCAAFWCFCRGCAAVYWPVGGEELTVSIEGEAKRAYDDTVGARVSTMLENTATSVQNI